MDLSNARRRRYSEQVREVKAERGCAYCDEHEVVCLDFHHRDPAQKEGGLAEALSQVWSWERIQVEMAKCDGVCANCHRKIEAGLLAPTLLAVA